MLPPDVRLQAYNALKSILTEAPSQTPLGSLQHSQTFYLDLKSQLLRGKEGKGGDGREGKGPCLASVWGPKWLIRPWWTAPKLDILNCNSSTEDSLFASKN